MTLYLDDNAIGYLGERSGSFSNAIVDPGVGGPVLQASYYNGRQPISFQVTVTTTTFASSVELVDTLIYGSSTVTARTDTGCLLADYTELTVLIEDYDGSCEFNDFGKITLTLVRV